MTNEISDPLAKFYDEADAQTAGVRDPITGIRQETSVVENRKNRQEESKRKAQVKQRVLGGLLSEENGREFLHDILTECFVFSIPVSEVSNFNAGKICIGKQLEADLKRTDIRKYNLMIEEGHERELAWNADAADQ